MGRKLTLIFGGTFDPIHCGHLQVCREASHMLGATEVRLLPSAQPPHRGLTGASAMQRLAMLRLAIADQPNWQADDLELQRSGASYSIDTLMQLRTQLAAQQALVLLLGADQYAKLDRWHRWQELSEYAHIAVMSRPNTSATSATVAQFFAKRVLPATQLHQRAHGNICFLPVTPITISASNIRARLQAGAVEFPDLPSAVNDYIRAQNLYQS
jgi:nicotinate-nucleotide adenylyltransferase